MRERKVWRAPAWLCPDLRGIADPGQEPDHRGEVVLHREQYVSRVDAERHRGYQNPIPVRHGWTFANQEENHPGDILKHARTTPPRKAGRPVPFGREVDWPSDVVGLLVTPRGIRLDRGQLNHPKKRLRARPTQIMTVSRGWRGLAGTETDLLVLVRHAPVGGGLGLHRIARTVRRDGGDSDAHLLLSDGAVTDGRMPTRADLDYCVRYTSGRFTRLVELNQHRFGSGLVVDGPSVLPRQLADDATARFPEVFQVSVRTDLLEDADDVERIAAEVSSLLLTPVGADR